MLYQTAQILGSYYFEKKRWSHHEWNWAWTLYIFSSNRTPYRKICTEWDILYPGRNCSSRRRLRVTIISPRRALRLKLYHQHQHQHRHSSHDSYHNGLHHRMRKEFTLIFDSGAKFITSAIHIGQLKSEEHDRHNPALDILLPV